MMKLEKGNIWKDILIFVSIFFYIYGNFCTCFPFLMCIMLLYFPIHDGVIKLYRILVLVVAMNIEGPL